MTCSGRIAYNVQVTRERYVAFDDFLFDRRRRTLTHAGTSLGMGSKTVELLALLLDHADEMVTRKQLMDELWPTEFVQESNLAQHVYLLRKALGAHGGGSYLQTVPRRGFRFVADVRCFDEAQQQPPPLAVAVSVPAGVSAPSLTTRRDGSARGQTLTALAVLLGVLVIALGVSRDENRPGAAFAALDRSAARAYSLGRYYWLKRDEPDLRRSISAFGDVVRRAPQNPLGYSGLADAYSQLALATALPAERKRLSVRAGRFAERAAALGPYNAEARTSYGYYLGENRMDARSARAEYRRAIALDPSYATAHHWYGITALWQGDFGTSVRELKAAVELDPTSLPSARWLGFAYYYAHRYDDAVAALRQALQLDSRDDATRLHLALALEQRGRLAEAQALLEGLRASQYDPALVSTWLAYAHALTGKRELALSELNRVIHSTGRRRVGGASIAAVFAALGRPTEGRPWLRSSQPGVDDSSLLPCYDPRIGALRPPCRGD